MYLVMKFVGLTGDQYARLENVLDEKEMTTEQPVNEERKLAQILRIRYVSPKTSVSKPADAGITAEVKVWVVQSGKRQTLGIAPKHTYFNLHTSRKILDRIMEAVGAFQSKDERVEVTGSFHESPPEY